MIAIKYLSQIWQGLQDGKLISLWINNPHPVHIENKLIFHFVIDLPGAVIENEGSPDYTVSRGHHVYRYFKDDRMVS